MDIKDTYGKTIDATDFVIGADGNKTQGINDAYIDEVRIMKRLFSSEEIDTYYLPYRFQITEMPIMSFKFFQMFILMEVMIIINQDKT